MTTALQFRTEQAATAMLRKDKAKVQWAILDTATCPKDIAALADNMQAADLAYRQSKAALEAALADKAVVPSGKRLIVTTGRQPLGDSVAPILYALVDGPSGRTTPVVSFDQFIKSNS